jgi:hypothetical protein
MKIKIRVLRDGAFTDQEVDALPAGVPGLAVHRAHKGGDMVISHIKTGTIVAGFPCDVFDCAAEIGEGGDWQGTPDQATVAAATEIIAGYGAFVDQAPAPPAVIAAERERTGMPGAV